MLNEIESHVAVERESEPEEIEEKKEIKCGDAAMRV